MDKPPEPNNNTFLGLVVITSDMETGLLRAPFSLSFTVGLEIISNVM